MNFLPASQMGTACCGTNPNQSRAEPRDPADPAGGQAAPLIQRASRPLMVLTTSDRPGRKSSGCFGVSSFTVLGSWFYFPTRFCRKEIGPQ